MLVTGADGQVGRALLSELRGDQLNSSRAIARRSIFPIRIRFAREVREVAPDIIINAGAYTAVDRAESERDLAMAINGQAPGVLAEEAKRGGALLIHYSTDYVFDGSKSSPWVEDDRN